MTGMIDANTKDNEHGLLPYPIILAANEGDPEAIKYIILHYGSYMANLSMCKLSDERGNTYWGINVDTHDRLRSKLMQGILAFKTVVSVIYPQEMEDLVPHQAA